MSPSRLMAIMDPLLNTSFLLRCLAAYAGMKLMDESNKNEMAPTTNGTDNTTKNKPQISPVRSSPNQVVPMEESEFHEINLTPDELYQARLSNQRLY